jgi:tellurite resistance protein TerC
MSFNSEHFPIETVGLFMAVFVFSLLMDLFQHRDHREVSIKNAGAWSLFWIATSLAFYGWLRWHHGVDHPDWGPLFLTGYVLEKTLSVDNLVVFIAIFRYFRIESGLQHRILYWGILGAIVFRAIFVGVGTAMLAVMGPWAEILFGLFVGWAAIQMLRKRDDDGDGEPDYQSMPLVRVFKRVFPLFPKLVGSDFFIDRPTAERLAAADPTITLAPGVQRWMTPAFVCLLVVEGSDVLFSVDSVPAVMAVSKEPLIVYTSMIFAVLGLRSLYFVVEALTKFMAHLEKAVIFVLFFIAAKMFVGAAEHILHVKVPWWSALPTTTQANYSMFIVLGMLACGVVASLIWPGKPDDGKDGESGDAAASGSSS